LLDRLEIDSLRTIPIRRPRRERSRRVGRFFGGKTLWLCFGLLIAVPWRLHSEEAPFDGAGEGSVVKNSPKEAVAQEVVFVGLASYGHYKIFASGTDCKMYTAGVEYDRHSWGYMLKARVDYVAEFLPVVLLTESDKTDIWGNSFSSAHHIVPGIGFSPIGARWIWRDGKAWKPYLMAKGGMVLFTEKAISSQASYENFSLQSSTGLQIRLNPRVDLRLGLFGDFHFSNAFIVPVNPGLDVMNANIGISYHLGGPGAR
jgi:hypothetical protein